jgi:hypothetical protein
MPRAEIATTQAKHTLEQLHAELGGKILDNKTEADRLRAAMVNVEAVLKLLDPEHNLRVIAVRRRKPNPWFKRGTIWRAILDTLREAETPLTAAEITGRMLAAKDVQVPARKAKRDLEGAIRASLKSHENKGVCVSGDSDPAQWTTSCQGGPMVKIR